MKHIVLGAGPVGRATATSLATRGLTVTLVSRSRLDVLPLGVEHLKASVLDAEALARGCEVGAVVYQCLGAPYHRWADQLPGLQAAAVRLAKSRGARLVSFENVYAYGRPGASGFDEASELAPCSEKGLIRASMIAELQAERARSNLAISHVRASDLFGPGMTGSALGAETIGRAVRGRRPRTLGNLDAPHTWTFTRDAGETLARAGTARESGEVYHVPSCEPRSQREVVHALAQLLGRELSPASTPTWVLKLVGLVRPDAGELVEMMYEFEQPFVVDDAKTRRELGLLPTPFEDALRETVAWYAAKRAA